MMFDSTTRRAYTLQLASPNIEPKSLNGIEERKTLWKNIWKTHELVNCGTAVLGDLWLSMRGGLSAEHAVGAKDQNAARVLLALGWLSVEAPASAVPQSAILARPDHTSIQRETILCERLKLILKADKVNESESQIWADACRTTFAAQIRDDAVWVDRRKLFDDAANIFSWNSFQAKEILIDEMMGGIDSYLSIDDASGESDKKDFAQKAGGWISRNWGTGKKSDTHAILAKLKSVLSINIEEFRNVESLKLLKAIHRAVGAEGDSQGEKEIVLKLIKKAFAWKGSPSSGYMALERIAESEMIDEIIIQRTKEAFEREISKKGLKAGRLAIPWASLAKDHVERATGLPYTLDKDHTWNYGVMLDHALRRISISHSWAKRAEASRRAFQEAATKPTDPIVTKWLSDYCAERTISSGSINPYLVRKNAMDGWKDVTVAWHGLGANATVSDKIRIARELQEELEKFGDIQLFESIAASDNNIWIRNGKPNPDLIKDEVERCIAKNDQSRFKVPAFRHPDALLNPVFCDYGNSRWKITYSAQDRANGNKPRFINLELWNGNRVITTMVRWRSKRLFNEIIAALNSEFVEEGSRNHRHARAIHANASNGIIKTAGIHELKDWNGRLQAPRSSFEKIHRMKSKGAPESDIEKAIEQIPWLITFSAALIPEGPWLDFVANNSTLQGKYCVRDIAPKGGYWLDGISFPFDHPDNGKNRKKMARIGLARLKGLRILSADLGHRHAAACAIWKTISSEELQARCDINKTAAPRDEDLFLHLKESGKSIVFRRIGGNSLTDGNPHPAPWAELERQFLIQLPGEEHQPRYANSDERNKTQAIERLIGASYPRTAKSWRMDRLQLDLIRLARMGLKRHATMARLATGLIATERILPGDIKKPFTNREDQISFVSELLVQQHRLLFDDLFPETEARTNWREATLGFLTEAELTPNPLNRKIDNRLLTKRMFNLASKFIDEPSLAYAWSALWRKKWQDLETQWPIVIKSIRNILSPKGSRTDKSIRRRGGLSMARITAIEEFRRKVQLAYFTRQQLDKPRSVGAIAFGSKGLKRLEKLRENRVRHIASRIASAALGIGPDPQSKSRLVKRFPACHAVVIENLGNYRPEASQTRRENRQLMQWSSSKIRKLLAEACQLAGLHLREVNPAFTSRQDSRTGAPGLRCAEVTWTEIKQAGGFWSKQLEKAIERDNAGKALPVDHYLIKLMDMKDEPPTKTLLIPRRGADLFTSAHAFGPIALQADLNAAANIGLIALTDPDWNGRWWFVPAAPDSHTPDPDLMAAQPLNDIHFLAVKDSNNSKGAAKKGKSNAFVRHFRDVGNAPLNDGNWVIGFQDYERDFSRRVCKRLENRFIPLPETPF